MWTYRVYREKLDDEHSLYSIREVFYAPGVTPSPSEAVDGYSAEPQAPVGEDLTELREDLGRMLKALDLPVIDEPVEEGT